MNCYEGASHIWKRPNLDLMLRQVARFFFLYLAGEIFVFRSEPNTVKRISKVKVGLNIYIFFFCFVKLINLTDGDLFVLKRTSLKRSDKM